jgi:hypothetical protein
MYPPVASAGFIIIYFGIINIPVNEVIFKVFPQNLWRKKRSPLPVSRDSSCEKIYRMDLLNFVQAEFLKEFLIKNKKKIEKAMQEEYFGRYI